jgi:hypothetical protein
MYLIYIMEILINNIMIVIAIVIVIGVIVVILLFSFICIVIDTPTFSKFVNRCCCDQLE